MASDKSEAPPAKPDPFHGAKLKVDRAVSHINEFNLVFNEFLKEDFYRIVLNDQLDNGQFGLRVVVLREPPAALSLIMGDAIHNLRTALDYVATAIVRAKKGSTQFITFPFHETRKNVEDALVKGPIEDAIPGIKNLILDRIKPFRDQGGDSILWSLTKLDKIDKHNMLVPVLGLTQVSFERMRDRTNNVFENITIGAQPTSQGYAIATSEKLNVEGKIQPSFRILFGESEVLKGQEVLPVLMHLTKAVYNAIMLIGELEFPSAA